MKLIIGRHGETASNRDGLVLGRSDSFLTVQGLATVRCVAEMLAEYEPEALFSSVLGRAAYTSALYSQRLGVPICFREALAELSCGVWEGRDRSEFKADRQSLRNTWTERPAGGESFADAEPRVNSLVAQLREMADRTNILIVGHSGVNRVLLKLWLGLEPRIAIRVLFPHDATFIIEETKPVRHRFADGAETEGLLFEP
jgi:broad specificity phosphatase PhoE